MKKLLVAVFLLVGCASKPPVTSTPPALPEQEKVTKVWYQLGRTADQAEEEEARARLYFRSHQPEPPARVQYDSGFAAGYLLATEEERDSFVRDWMLSKGYHLVPISETTNQPVRLGNHDY